jgi:enamine deaminase RidA (YjgF/YER057c/UK114 family)
MNRTPVNPWQWSLNFGFDQAELLDGSRRQLVCSGQASVDGDGNPQHAGDMAAQVALTIDNLEPVLAAGGMSLANLVQVTIYTTDVDGLLEQFGVLAERLAGGGARFASTLVGVTRLAFPDLLVEIAAIAVD